MSEFEGRDCIDRTISRLHDALSAIALRTRTVQCIGGPGIYQVRMSPTIVSAGLLGALAQLLLPTFCIPASFSLAGVKYSCHPDTVSVIQAMSPATHYGRITINRCRVLLPAPHRAPCNHCQESSDNHEIPRLVYHGWSLAHFLKAPL